MTRPFFGKNANVSGFLAGHIPCSLNAKDAKFWHFVYFISTLLWRKREANSWHPGFTVCMIWRGITLLCFGQGLDRAMKNLEAQFKIIKIITGLKLPEYAQSRSNLLANCYSQFSSLIYIEYNFARTSRAEIAGRD